MTPCLGSSDASSSTSPFCTDPTVTLSLKYNARGAEADFTQGADGVGDAASFHMRTAQVYQWSGDELRGYQGRLYSHEHRAATEGSARTEPS